MTVLGKCFRECAYLHALAKESQKKRNLIFCYFVSQFRVHAAFYYPLLCETIMFDLKVEMRSILRKFFARVGSAFGVTAKA